MKDIFIYGAGGFGMEVAFLIEEINKVALQWNIVGYIDDEEAKYDKTFYRYDVLGGRNFLLSIRNDVAVAVAVGSPIARRNVVAAISKANIEFPVLIHPNVVLSPTVRIGHGSIICAGNILTVEITIGKHVHLNLDCTVGHGAVLGDCVTVNPSVNISGDATLGSYSNIGTASQIIEGVSVGENVVLGAGAVVIRDIPSHTVAVGVPAQVIKQRQVLV